MYLARQPWYIAGSDGDSACKKTFLSYSKRENNQKAHHQGWSLQLNLIFVSFLEFCTSGCLCTAYFDIPRQGKRFGGGIIHVLHDFLAYIKFACLYLVWVISLVWYCIFFDFICEFEPKMSWGHSSLVITLPWYKMNCFNQFFPIMPCPNGILLVVDQV